MEQKQIEREASRDASSPSAGDEKLQANAAASPSAAKESTTPTSQKRSPNKQSPGASSPPQIAAADAKTKKYLAEFEANRRAGLSKAGLSKEIVESIQNRLKAATFGTTPKEFFKRYDADGGGTLDFDELMVIIRKVLKIPPADLRDKDLFNFMNALDDDKSGTLDIEELADFVVRGEEAFMNKLDPEKLNGSSAWGGKLMDVKDPFDIAVEKEVADHVDENTVLRAKIAVYQRNQRRRKAEVPPLKQAPVPNLGEAILGVKANGRVASLESTSLSKAGARPSLTSRASTQYTETGRPPQPSRTIAIDDILERIRGPRRVVPPGAGKGKHGALAIGERRPRLDYTWGFTRMTNIGRENQRLVNRMCNIREGGHHYNGGFSIHPTYEYDRMMHWKAKVKHRELHWHKIEMENAYAAEMRDKWAISSGYTEGPQKGSWFKEPVFKPRLEQGEWNERFHDIRAPKDILEETLSQRAPPIELLPISRDSEDPYPTEDMDKKYRLPPWKDRKWDYQREEKDIWDPDICGY